MNRCLNDRTLLLLYDGEGTIAQRSHLTACEDCSGRYERLGRDLKVIRQVLRQESPPQTAHHRPRGYAFRWLPAAAALAMAVVLLWGGLWMRKPSAPVLFENVRQEDFWRLLEEVSTDLFSLDDAMAEEIWPQAADIRALSVALGEEPPCEWDNLSAWDDGESGGEGVPAC